MMMASDEVDLKLWIQTTLNKHRLVWKTIYLEMVLHGQYWDNTMVSVEIPKSEEVFLLALDDLIEK